MGAEYSWDRPGSRRKARTGAAARPEPGASPRFPLKYFEGDESCRTGGDLEQKEWVGSLVRDFVIILFHMLPMTLEDKQEVVLVLKR